MKPLLPSEETLKIIGGLVRKRRIEAHMTQQELAKGICTQATISSLENSRTFNKWKILPDIITRLNIDISQLEDRERYVYGEKPLTDVENKLMELKYEDAHTLISKIRFENIDSINIKARYFCDLGFIEIKVGNDFDKMIYYFIKVLREYNTKDNLIYVAWCSLGLSIAYNKFNFTIESKYRLHEAVTYLNELIDGPNLGENFRFEKVRLGVAIITYAFLQSDFEIVYEESDKLINFLEEHYSFFGLRAIYDLKKSSFECEKRIDEARFLEQIIPNYKKCAESFGIKKLIEQVQ